MEDSIGKFSNVAMVAQLTHAHANDFFMSKVCFGCGMFDTTEIQEQGLKSMYETPLVRKLNLVRHFLRKMLYSRVTSIEIGTMAPRKAISALTIKSCISHQRMKT